MSQIPQEPLVARYRLVAVLGEGGMGRVWRARDELLGREVAVKEITPEGLSRSELGDLRARAIREARAIAQINHPNVVRIFDVVEQDGAPWIIMELVPSRSLYEVLNDDGPMSPQQAAKMGLDVLAALRAAHDVGILHRDVKPANVLLATGGRVVLTDFGLATLVGDATMTRTGIVIGSPAYLAPERASDEPADAKSDLWSLGAVLFTAVEGKPPYVRSSPMATLAALMVEPAPIPQNAGVLHPAIEALLRKDPSERADVDEAERLLRAAASASAARPATTTPATTTPASTTPAWRVAAAGSTTATPGSASPDSTAGTPGPTGPQPTTAMSGPADPEPTAAAPGLIEPDPTPPASTTPLSTATPPTSSSPTAPLPTGATPRLVRRRLIWAVAAAVVLAGGIVAIQPTFGAEDTAYTLPVAASASAGASQPVSAAAGPRSTSPSRVAAPHTSGKPASPPATAKPSPSTTASSVRPTKPTPSKTTTARRVPTVTLVNNTDLTYTGGKWSVFATRGLGDHQDDISCTMIDGASASYEFTGTGVDYLTEINPDEGKVDVYLDGNFQETVNLKGGPPRQVKAVVFSRNGLPRSKHTIRIVNKGTTLGMIDALRIRS